VLTGKGLFFLTEGRMLFLDLTAGHYQMTWGYNHPVLNRAITEALEKGIVWDCHSNLPGDFVKQLSWKLVEICNRDARGNSPGFDSVLDDDDALNTVLLGTATGSVACSTAMKLAINYFRKRKGSRRKPVFVALNGNYHGTDIMMQRLRGMWPEFLTT
jgi:adenosylmethionine-8-amino-7-oxononanoate aminotransferase